MCYSASKSILNFPVECPPLALIGRTSMSALTVVTGAKRTFSTPD
jgi:hypothetical protein